MTRKLILHAGLHKTGTTSIQKECRKHTEILKREGYWYPLFKSTQMNGLNGNNAPENHSKLINQMFSNSKLKIGSGKPGERIPNLIKDQVRKEFLEKLIFHNTNNIIISAERISTLAEDELCDLRDWFSSLGFGIELICFVRRPSDWINSLVSQRVCGKSGPRLVMNQVISESKNERGILAPRIDKLLTAFPKAEFLNFEEALASHYGLIGTFFNKIGIENCFMTTGSKENIGSSDHSTRINSRINAIIGHRTKSSETMAFYSRLPQRHPNLFAIPGKKFHLRESEVAPLLPLLIEENNWLREKLGEGFYDEVIKFSNEPILLNDEERHFLIDNFSNTEEPIRSIVKKYIAEH